MILIWLLVSTVIIAVLIYYLFLSAIFDNLLHAVLNEPQVVPSYIPVVGFLFKFLKDPYEFVHGLHQQYGDRFTIKIVSNRNTFLNDQTTFVNRIAKDSTFTLGFFDKVVHNVGNIRWPCATNAEVNHASVELYHEFLSGHELLVLNRKTCEHLIKRLTQDRLASSLSETINLFDYFGEIMLDTAVTVLYGETFARSQSDLYASCRAFEMVAGTMMLDIPFKSFFLRSAIRQRDQFIERFIDLKPNDDMSNLVLARIELMTSLDHGKHFNERDKAGHHALLIWAAIVNTIPVACWSLVDLLLHSDAFEAVKGELNAKVTSITSLCEKEILDELHILHSCIQETMRRILPMMVQRQASQNITVTCKDGTQMGVRKNDIVIYPALVKHLDPKVSFSFSPSE